MPDVNGPDKEPDGKRRFMREKIVRQPLTKKQVAMRVAVFFFIALAAGAAAGISYAVARPIAERYLGETTEETTQITIPKDEPESTAPETTSAAETETQETEPIEDMLQSAIEQYEFGIDDFNTLHSSLRMVAQEADKGIVTVHSVRQQVDWFDNPIESSGLYAGAVIAATRTELLILTPEGAVENADSIKVALSDGSEVGGTIKQSDTIAGMAIVSVNTEGIDPNILKSVKAIELGNSYSVRQGDMLIAVGGPAGIVHSTAYGEVTYVMRNVQMTDGICRIIYADLCSSAGMGTFLVNTNGQMVGWVTDEYKTESSPNVTSAMAISDYKGILERMSNGRQAAYFGIIGQEVSGTMAEQGLPNGVYVVNAIVDGPAYNQGIQNGDIITKIGEKDIRTIRDFQNQVENLNPGDVVTVLVQRNAIDEYKEIEYHITIGAR